MNIPATVVMNQEFTDLDVIETSNPYRTCIQGQVDEPITLNALLKRALKLLGNEADIQGSTDHPADLIGHEHTLRATARIRQYGGVPAICGSTAQSNIELFGPTAFLCGELCPMKIPLLAEGSELVAQHRVAIEHRHRQVVARSNLDKVTDAEYGGVPVAVHQRATVPCAPTSH